MKTGIITYHSVYNFGANLQAYSTVCYLRNQGHEPVIINWVPLELEKGYNKGNPSQQAEAHRRFIEQRLPLTAICRNTEDVVRIIREEGIEAILTGSDAVLQHKTFLSRVRLSRKGITIKEKRSNVIFPNPFWGSYIPMIDKGIPVSLMSASSQNMNFRVIRGTMRREIGKALLRFRRVTVRDDWTRDMVSYFTRGRVVPDITPDPVFAYNQNVRDQLSREEITQKFGLPDNYVLFSFKNKGIVTGEWLRRCQEILEKEGKTGVLLTMPGGVIISEPPMKVIPPPLNPEEWYALIKYSSGYIGENMHPIVVSLHNAVPFFSFDDYGIVKFRYFTNEESSKIYNILSYAGFLANRTGTIGRNYRCPEPEKVLALVRDFDQEWCRRFSEKQLENYNKMMQQIFS
ncbi:MAG: polysaccharide pyruvyl transferase family protein [Bacteroidota bacterium]